MATFSRRSTLIGGFAVMATIPFAGARIALAQQAPSGGSGAPLGDGLTVMESDGRFREWIRLLSASGLARDAESGPPYTMFVPTDGAMEPYALDFSEMLGLVAWNVNATPDVPRIDRVVRSHTVEGMHPLSEFSGKKMTLRSTFNTEVDVDGTTPGVLTVTVHRPTATAVQRITTQPLMASNAVIYPVETVSVTR